MFESFEILRHFFSFFWGIFDDSAAATLAAAAVVAIYIIDLLSRIFSYLQILSAFRSITYIWYMRSNNDKRIIERLEHYIDEHSGDHYYLLRTRSHCENIYYIVISYRIRIVWHGCVCEMWFSFTRFVCTFSLYWL